MRSSQSSQSSKNKKQVSVFPIHQSDRFVHNVPAYFVYVVDCLNHWTFRNLQTQLTKNDT